MEDIKTIILMYVYFVVLLLPLSGLYFIFSLPHGIACLFTKSIRTEKELSVSVKKLQKRLGLENIEIVAKIDDSVLLTKVDFVEINKKYILVLKRGVFTGREETVLHELMHIKKGHVHLNDEPSLFFKMLLNISFDLIVNLSSIRYWSLQDWSLENTFKI